MQDTNRSFYANSVHIIMSIYDVLLSFRTQAPLRVEEQVQESAVVSTDEFDVRMSPQHAKALAALLIKNIREYEKQFNTQIIIPPDLQTMWDEAVRKGSS